MPRSERQELKLFESHANAVRVAATVACKENLSPTSFEALSTARPLLKSRAPGSPILHKVVLIDCSRVRVSLYASLNLSRNFDL